MLQNVSPTTEPGNSAADTTTVDVCVSVSASGPIDLQQLVVTFDTVAGTAGTIVIILLGNFETTIKTFRHMVYCMLTTVLELFLL